MAFFSFGINEPLHLCVQRFVSLDKYKILCYYISMKKKIMVEPSAIPLNSTVCDDICTVDGTLLCHGNMVVDKRIFELLQNFDGKIAIVVEDEEPAKDSDAYKQHEDNTFKLNEDIRERVLTGVEYIYSKDTPIEEVASEATEIGKTLCNAVMRSNTTEINLSALKVSDEYTFKHSVDVATMAMLVAKKMGKPQYIVEDVGVSGILHDIGKVDIPNEILNKPGKLTDDEFEVIKLHTVRGYERLKNEKVKDVIKLAVLQHHENVDGTGYPFKLKSDKINDIAKILSVVDVYDALVTARPYKLAKSAAESLEIIMSMINKFDNWAISAFLSSLVAFPNGTTVTMSDGRSCKVLRQNPKYPLRPVILDETSGEVMDLANDLKYLSLLIV